MPNTSFDKYLEKKIKSKPNLKQELEKVDRAVEIAYQIYILRKKKGLTQTQLAKSIGVSQSNIARIENADYNHYTIKTLDKVAKGLNADLNIFINLPEKTINLINTVNSFSTTQNFNLAGIEGKFFASGDKTLPSKGTITLEPFIECKNVRYLAQSKKSEIKTNNFYYQSI